MSRRNPKSSRSGIANGNGRLPTVAPGVSAPTLAPVGRASRPASPRLRVPASASSARGRSAAEPSSLSAGLIACLVGAFLWSYWSTIVDLWAVWGRSEDHSGGRLVAFIAVYLVWSDRKALAKLPLQPCWWGLGVLLFAQAVRLGGVLLAYGSIEQYSLVLTVVGVVLLVFGWPVTWRLKWVLLFCFLLVPLPRRVHGAIAVGLQEFATSSAVFGLELLGQLVTREGNVLRIDGHTIAVAEACSGLRMLSAFLIVSCTLAFIVKRPMWQKALLVASSVPVAILANTLRLIATALLYKVASDETAERFFHDFAGLTMMPIAVAASVGLLVLMRWVAASPPAVGTAAPASGGSCG